MASLPPEIDERSKRPLDRGFLTLLHDAVGETAAQIRRDISGAEPIDRRPHRPELLNDLVAPSTRFNHLLDASGLALDPA